MKNQSWLIDFPLQKESPKPGSDSDGIDFFASDEESTAKANPKAVVQKPKQLKKTKDNEKKKEISKVLFRHLNKNAGIILIVFLL